MLGKWGEKCGISKVWTMLHGIRESVKYCTARWAVRDYKVRNSKDKLFIMSDMWNHNKWIREW